MRRDVRIIVLTVTAGALVAITGCRDAPPEVARLDLSEVLAGGDTEGFARAYEPRAFSFPADHGPHPEFKTEWWYVTGNLAARSGDRFGFQLTFFRSALRADSVATASDWRTNQIYMAHFAVTDVENDGFHTYERFSRAAAGLAGAAGTPMRVWLDDWFLEIGNAGDVTTVRLSAREGDVRLDLTARAEKPPLLQGDGGLSQKGSEPGNASYYYSLTRMAATGALMLPERRSEVTGRIWMDREWGTSALEETQVGWDWFALQLDDGSDVMYYQLRRKDGGTDETSRGALVDRAGGKRDILWDAVRIDVLGRWTSPRGGEYPSGWRFRDAQNDLDLTIEPLVADQEFARSFRYWEGAVRVAGMHGDRSVTGYGYVELTGYAGTTDLAR